MSKKKNLPVIDLPIKEVKPNPENPRFIKDDKYQKLKRSIEEFPEMLRLRPLIIDENNIVLGGNMRLKVLNELKYQEVPTIQILNLTPEQKREFVIKDNASFGSWDYEMLANEYDIKELEEWGVDVVHAFTEEVEDEIEEETGEVEFSEFIGEENNYVVLFFDKEVDWLQAQTHFNLKTVSSKRANGKPWSSGIGRVINGADYLDKLNEDR